MPPRKPEYNDDASEYADRRRDSARGSGGASAAGARA